MRAAISSARCLASSTPSRAGGGTLLYDAGGASGDWEAIGAENPVARRAPDGGGGVVCSSYLRFSPVAYKEKGLFQLVGDTKATRDTIQMSDKEFGIVGPDNNVDYVRGYFGLRRSSRNNEVRSTEFYIKSTTDEGKVVSECKYCQKVYIAGSSHGTSNMRRHLRSQYPSRNSPEDFVHNLHDKFIFKIVVRYLASTMLDKIDNEGSLNLWASMMNP
ncbi:hypothetical protein RJ640_009218 [Escallonia rubra]|uniref:BED-type domain-containing protein n=1 Tax=Escallonia rubra TaxID=112253 RepID=A0AA88R9J8_9ASTE|nr:hypothetical protein RJ640_009218 [Escallonia rubra]